MATTKANAKRIVSGTITNTQISSSAAIALSKLATDPLARANHTGSQAASTISDFSDAADARITAAGLATTTYVNNLVNGKKYKDAVRLKATGNIALTGVVSVDGFDSATGDRIAAFSQSTATQDGLYVANDAGAWTRTSDFAVSSSAASASFRVQEGTAGADTEWTVTNNVGSDVVGTDGLTLAQTGSGSTYTAGTGLDLSGNEFSVEYGTTSTTACVGDDSRLSNARTPVGTSLTSASVWVGSAGNAAAAVSISGDATLSNAGAVAVTKINGATLGTTTATSGNILVGDGDSWESVEASGDATLASTGAFTLASTITRNAKIVMNEVPSGTVNGTNDTFTLAAAPASGKLALFVGGARLKPGSGNDYVLTTDTIVFEAGAIPESGEAVLADYLSS